MLSIDLMQPKPFWAICSQSCFCSLCKHIPKQTRTTAPIELFTSSGFLKIITTCTVYMFLAVLCMNLIFQVNSSWEHRICRGFYLGISRKLHSITVQKNKQALCLHNTMYIKGSLDQGGFLKTI